MSRRKKKTRKNQRLLLADIARALNAAEKAGLNPGFAHGSVFTDAGYILPLYTKKGKWAVRVPRRRYNRDS